MNTMAPMRVEMEFWTADLPYTIVNPFDLAGSVSPDDPAAKFTTRLLAERSVTLAPPRVADDHRILQPAGSLLLVLVRPAQPLPQLPRVVAADPFERLCHAAVEACAQLLEGLAHAHGRGLSLTGR